MHIQTHTCLPWAWLACALASAGGMASAAALDEEKLRLLSCDMTGATVAGRRGAVDWLNQAAQVFPKDEGLGLAGPLTLGKACIKNLRMVGSFGVAMIQGEICNAVLADFTEALAAAGIALDKDADGRVPGAILGKMGERQGYVITRGMIDMRTGEVVPTSAPYAFMCAAAGDGPR